MNERPNPFDSSPSIPHTTTSSLLTYGDSSKSLFSRIKKSVSHSHIPLDEDEFKSEAIIMQKL